MSALGQTALKRSSSAAIAHKKSSDLSAEASSAKAEALARIKPRRVRPEHLISNSILGSAATAPSPRPISRSLTPPSCCSTSPSPSARCCEGTGPTRSARHCTTVRPTARNRRGARNRCLPSADAAPHPGSPPSRCGCPRWCEGCCRRLGRPQLDARCRGRHPI
jgi:hypothetical protein